MRRNRISMVFGLMFVVACAAVPALAAGTEKVLYSFGQSFAGGEIPTGGLVFDGAGNLYGVTQLGGNAGCFGNGCGTVFELSPGAGGTWTKTILYSFSGPDGGYPESRLIFDAAGNLYGTTELGSSVNIHCDEECGTVFELSPGANGQWTEKVLYNFCSVGDNCADGFDPSGPLVLDAAGNLYGTVAGGGAHFQGAVFELSPGADGAWTENLLYSFMANGSGDGGGPMDGVIFDGAGNLYGETYYGGGTVCNANYGCGTIFEVSRDAKGKWHDKILYNFNDTTNLNHGGGPANGLTFDASGNLYGTTTYGGVHGDGVVFKLAPGAKGTWTEAVLHSFGSEQIPNGAGPSAVIFDSAGNLLGTTSDGGPGCSARGEYGCGTIFQLAPGQNGAWTYSTLFGFHAKNGWNPYGVIVDSAGNLYGTTAIGGAYLSACGPETQGCGTVWEFTP
jgi:uncharacterized repeat protein (TIGR03803 family)